jgi:hypothetical protein
MITNLRFNLYEAAVRRERVNLESAKRRVAIRLLSLRQFPMTGRTVKRIIKRKAKNYDLIVEAISLRERMHEYLDSNGQATGHPDIPFVTMEGKRDPTLCLGDEHFLGLF